MTIPSFARPTTSSTLKASPGGSKSEGVITPDKMRSTIPSEDNPKPFRRLKRPSTLTRQERDKIAYNADLYHIKPLVPSKPCLLAALPSELRSAIYSHVFGDLQRPILMNYSRKRYTSPALLHTCRAVRIEAAYMYFTEASFTWVIKNLNFTAMIKWFEHIQPSHRNLLRRNRHLTIEIIPRLQCSYTYPPKDFLLDDTMQNHWRACHPFGNLYSVKAMRLQSGTHESLARVYDPAHDPAHDNVRVCFILFCRLAAWCRLCSQAGYADIRWNYTFDLPSDSHGKRALNATLGEHEAGLRLFLQQLKKLWTRTRCESKIKLPLLELLDAFIQAYAQMESHDPISYRYSEMIERLKSQRERIRSWTRLPSV